MRQGTVSILVGCHSIMHSFYVFKAWKYVHGSYPSFMETVCILLHDVGHWGLDYIDKPEHKKKHWELGAKIARLLFGEEGYALVAGHTSHSGEEYSLLREPDKFSWLVASNWWLITNQVVEPKLQRPNMTKLESAIHWKNKVREYVIAGDKSSLHDLYMADYEVNK